MTGTQKQLIMWLLEQDPEKIFEIKEHKIRRSLNANAYAWALIGKIADRLRADKNDIYLLMLKRYGQSEMVSVVSSIDVRGYFKYYSEAGRTFLQGKEFIHYRVYKGSSEMTSQEMAILIDGIVDEAKGMGIDTATPDELERMKSLWT